MNITVWGIYFSYSDGSEACMGWAETEQLAQKSAERKIAAMQGRRRSDSIPTYRVAIIPHMG